MLSLSRLESDEKPLKLTDVRLADTVVNVVVSMEQKISGKEINITGLEELSQTVISGDSDLLHQVIYNLTDNAVKFTPYGGCINFNLHRIQDSVEFKIRNTGDGIPGKDIPFIFERFYKIDKSRSTHKDSLGLGLYICKTVAELHNGIIKVESDSKTYTEFTVTLPIKNQ
jgi:signal transduction histidine kinase